MAEFGGGFALQELHVVDQQQVDAAQPLLEAERRLALHGGDEVVHEVVGRQVDDVPARLGRSGGPGNGVEQVGFTQAHARMNVNWVEADGVVGGRMGHLFGHLQRHLVGRADDEAVEGHLGVERRARQRVAARRRRRNGGLSHHAGRCRRCRNFGLDRLARRFGLMQPRPGLAVDAHREVQPGEAGGFGAERFEDLLGVVRLHPGGQEPGRHAQMGKVVDDLFQLEPGKPGVEHILAHRGLQAGPHALEQLIRTEWLAVLAHHHRPLFAAALPLSVTCIRYPTCTIRRRVHRHRV